MTPVIFVLLDGLNALTARRCMGFMAALEEARSARYVELQSALPPLSRPLYATLISGLKPVESGIVHNDITRRCPTPTIFSRARDAGLTTAAAAYYWMSELCNAAPFDPARDRLTDDVTLPIAHGIFYSTDTYPDNELFHDAACLLQRHKPHLLLVHSMGIDNAGHQHGADSLAYRDAARFADGLLARWLPQWTAAGYAVLVTSDHGMDTDAEHNDNMPATRQVPLWLAGKNWRELPLPREQTMIAPLVAGALGLSMADC